MHFTGRTWRPPYEANSVIIQATSGYTYGKCRFCSLCKDECFRMSPMEEFEEDLAEIKSYQKGNRHIWELARLKKKYGENVKGTISYQQIQSDLAAGTKAPSSSGSSLDIQI